MTYEDAVIYLEVFVKQAEDLELNSERFREKVEPYRLSLLRHAADNVTSQRMVTYVFHRLINYVQTGDYRRLNRVGIRTDLYRLKMTSAFEAKP
jgi:hypothetical protein